MLDNLVKTLAGTKLGRTFIATTAFLQFYSTGIPKTLDNVIGQTKALAAEMSTAPHFLDDYANNEGQWATGVTAENRKSQSVSVNVEARDYDGNQIPGSEVNFNLNAYQSLSKRAKDFLNGITGTGAIFFDKELGIEET